jgi:hypothetical protein
MVFSPVSGQFPLITPVTGYRLALSFVWTIGVVAIVVIVQVVAAINARDRLGLGLVQFGLIACKLAPKMAV